ncbi:ABC transporter permease [uncultured Litoreibacter sp.]|uniref:ABC transporter permease n=1 Tax=uncultured Litoreibacter sp. TaxID=1392394 RepID=UPI0026167FE5|nr:ABC transporter permease [uncultured Litoreibacter sp.]
MSDIATHKDRIPAKLRFQTGRVIFALLMREMSTTHGRSPGGYLWAILEPVAGITLLTVAFGFFLRSPPMGTSFALFYATGLLPFVMYVDLMGKISQTIRFSRPLLVYPKVTFLDAILARFILNFITQIMVYYLVIMGIFVIFDVEVALDFKSIALSLALASFLGFSLGSVNSLLFSFAPVWERIWSVINRPALLVSCIFYTYEGLPETLQNYIWYNPLAHIVGLMRQGFYAEYTAEYVSVPYVLLWCIIPSTLGVYFLRVYHKIILNEL